MENKNQTEQPFIGLVRPPKKSGSLVKIIVGLFAIAILGFGGWHAYDSGLFGVEPDEAPPSLSIGGAVFQGKFVEATFGFLQFDDGDRESYQVSSIANFKNGTKGINYYYPKSNLTYDQVIKSIKPLPDLKILLVQYDAQEPWAGDLSKNGCFKTYPKGLYDQTCEVAETKIDSEIIEKNKSFAILANNSYEYDSNLLADAKTLSDTFIIGDFNGWVMYPLASTMDLTDSRIRSIWAQKSTNEFEKINNVADLTDSREFKMVWLKLGNPVSDPIATGGETDRYQTR